MYKIEAIPEHLGAHYLSQAFKTKALAERFRTEYLIDPKGLNFRIVAVQSRRASPRRKRSVAVSSAAVLGDTLAGKAQSAHKR